MLSNAINLCLALFGTPAAAGSWALGLQVELVLSVHRCLPYQQPSESHLVVVAQLSSCFAWARLAATAVPDAGAASRATATATEPEADLVAQVRMHGH
jgi:hypothetical protein